MKKSKNLETNTDSLYSEKLSKRKKSKKRKQIEQISYSSLDSFDEDYVDLGSYKDIYNSMKDW